MSSKGGSRSPPRVGMFSCAGGSNTGLMGLKAVVAASEKFGGDRASLICLAGISSQIPGIVKGAKEREYILSVDGCETQCASKTLKKFGIQPTREIVVTKDYGVEKNHDLMDEHGLETVRDRIQEEVARLIKIGGRRNEET